MHDSGLFSPGVGTPFFGGEGWVHPYVPYNLPSSAWESEPCAKFICIVILDTVHHLVNPYFVSDHSLENLTSCQTIEHVGSGFHRLDRWITSLLSGLLP